MTACEMTRPGFGLSVFRLALLYVLQTTTAKNYTTLPNNNYLPAQNYTTLPNNNYLPAQNYTTLPNNITVAIGKPATFQCGVLTPGQFNFTLYGSRENKTLTCPGDHTKYLDAQETKGYCVKTGDMVFAIWLIGVTSNSDNNTRVVCKLPGQPPVEGYLWLFEIETYFATLIGCVFGGFFGILIIFVLSYIMVRRSERFQRCFRGKDREDDIIIMVTKN